MSDIVLKSVIKYSWSSSSTSAKVSEQGRTEYTDTEIEERNPS